MRLAGRSSAAVATEPEEERTSLVLPLAQFACSSDASLRRSTEIRVRCCRVSHCDENAPPKHHARAPTGCAVFMLHTVLKEIDDPAAHYGLPPRLAQSGVVTMSQRLRTYLARPLAALAVPCRTSVLSAVLPPCHRPSEIGSKAGDVGLNPCDLSCGFRGLRALASLEITSG